jgi:hypothetical protein
MRDRPRKPQGHKRGPLTGPNPTDHGKLGSTIHLITDRNGLPVSLGISGADLHDSQGLQPLVRGIPPVRSHRGPRRRRPGKLHGDKGYDYGHLRRWLGTRGIRHRIARKGIESCGRPSPLGGREKRLLAGRLPSASPPLRTQSRALPRLRRHRGVTHQLPAPGSLSGVVQCRQ